MSRAKNTWRMLMFVQIIAFLFLSLETQETINVALGLLIICMMFSFALGILQREFLANAGQQRVSAETGGQDVIHALVWAQNKGYAIEAGIVDGKPAMEAGYWRSARKGDEPSWYGVMYYDYHKGRFINYQQQKQ